MTDSNQTYQFKVPQDCKASVRVNPVRYLSNDSYSRIFNEGLSNIVADRNLTGTDFRVLFHILSIMEYENLVNTSQQQIAESIGIGRPDVTRSIKKLMSRDYIRIREKIGSQNLYMVNPHIAFRSRAGNLSLLKESWANLYQDTKAS